MIRDYSHIIESSNIPACPVCNKFLQQGDLGSQIIIHGCYALAHEECIDSLKGNKSKVSESNISLAIKRRLLYTINAAASINFFDFRFEETLVYDLDKVVPFVSSSKPVAIHCTEFGYLYLYSSEEDDNYWLSIESDNCLIAYLFNDFVIHTTEEEFFAETVNEILGSEYINPSEPYEGSWKNIITVLKSEYSHSTNTLCDVRGHFGDFVIEKMRTKQLRIALELAPESAIGKARIISAIIPHESPLFTIFHQFIDKVGRYPLMVEAS